MPNSGLLSANVLICESVLSESNGLKSAIRLIDFLTVHPETVIAHFYALTLLRSKSFDPHQHRLVVRMEGFRNGKWESVAEAPECRFTYGFVDPSGPGGFVLTTEFSINLANLGGVGIFYIQAWLDDEL